MQTANTITATDSSVAVASDVASVFALFIGMIIFYLVIFIAIYAVSALFTGMIFKKARVPSWIAWVPVYNNWKLLEIGGQQGYWSLLAFIPFVNIVSAVFMYIAMYHITLKLQKDGMFVLLAIFFPVVWLVWLAIDSSVWDESKGAPRLDHPTEV